MVVYILALLSIVLLYPLIGKRKCLIDGVLTKTNNLYYIAIVSTVLIVIAGFRDVTIGIDTLNYKNIFDFVNLYGFDKLLYQSTETGYTLFQILIGKAFGDFQMLLIISAFFYIGVISYLIFNYSKNPMISYLLFIFFDFYTFSFSGIRQTLAITFVLLAFIQIKNKKIFQFLALVMIASTFHITALIFLPTYWLGKFKFSRKNLFFFFLCGLILFLTKDYFQMVMNNYARISYDAAETGGFRLYIVMITTVIIGIIYRKPFKLSNSVNVYLFYMMVSAVVIFPIIRFNPVTLRLYYYFFIFMIIYVPNILSVIKDKAILFIGTIFYLFIGSFWFFTSIINSKQLIPYLFFWNK